MTIYGVTPEGFVLKPLSVIEKEIDDALRGTFGNHIFTDPQDVYGQLKGIFAEREALLWELKEAIYNSQYPDNAEGVSLDDALSIVGLKRLGAAFSKIEGQVLFGTAGTNISAGTKFSVQDDPDTIFSTSQAVILIVGTDEVQTITFSGTPTSGSFKLKYNTETTATINYDAINTDVQDALNALASLSAVTVTGNFAAGFVVTFAGADGKQEQPILVEDSNTLDDGGAVTITITETTPGVYQGEVDCNCDETGPVSVALKMLTVIDTPISGLTSVFNPAAAIIGRDIETDAEFRARRNVRLQISKAGPTEAIRAAILDLNNDITKTTLEDVRVFENTTLTTVGSRPGKSIEAFAYETGAATTRDQEVAEAIFASKAAGIESYGTISKTVIDSMGFSNTVKLSRPTGIDIYLDLALTVDSNYPSDGNTQVENLMIAWGNALGIGNNVIVYPHLAGQLMTIPGITDMAIDIGISASPSGDANIVIDDGSVSAVEISRWDAANINVTS